MNKITMMAIAVTALCLASPIICFADIDAKEIYNYKQQISKHFKSTIMPILILMMLFTWTK